MQVAILIISAASLAVGLTALWVAWQNHRRSRERADARFVAIRVERNNPGKFRVYNQGTDTAFDVTVEAWTDIESAEAHRREMKPEEFVEITLPRRTAGEMGDLGPMPTSSASLLPGGTGFDDMRRESEHLHRALIEQRVSEQVTVHVNWRSRRGVWSTNTDSTG